LVAGPLVGAVVGAVLSAAAAYFLWYRRLLRREGAERLSKDLSARTRPVRVSVQAFSRVRSLYVHWFYSRGLHLLRHAEFAQARVRFRKALDHSLGTQRAALHVLIGACLYMDGDYSRAFDRFWQARRDADDCCDSGIIDCANADLEVTERALQERSAGLTADRQRTVYPTRS
jgi:hypothetical protein